MPRQRSGERVASFSGATLRETRRNRGLSIDALGELVAVTRSALVGYEHDRVRPGIEILVDLSRALRVDPYKLMGIDRGAATLAHLRATAGLTKTAIARRLGMGRSTWSHIERGTRSLQPAVAERLAPLLDAPVAEVLAARARGIAAEHAAAARATQDRHFALAHRLAEAHAGIPATEVWIAQRAQRYAAVAGVDLHVVCTDPADYQERTGVEVGPNDWGSASWAYDHHVVFIDPTRGDGTRATVELVIAHEVAHLGWHTLRHLAGFFDRVQQLIDDVAAAGAHDR